MKTRPMSDRIFVRRDDPESHVGLLIIPQQSQALPLVGTVTGIGPDVSVVSVGDRVLFEKWTGETHEIDGEDVMVFEEADMLAVVS